MCAHSLTGRILKKTDLSLDDEVKYIHEKFVMTIFHSSGQPFSSPDIEDPQYSELPDGNN